MICKGLFGAVGTTARAPVEIIHDRFASIVALRASF
jgi:hypothetical protein